MTSDGRKNALNYLLAGIAVSGSLYILALHSDDPAIVAASIFLALICLTDSLYGKIPNLCNAGLALFGFGLHSFVSGLEGLLFALAGLGLGFGLLLLPYLMGGFGAGDVKALAALGAVTGPVVLLHVFVYMAFWGGGLALLHNLCARDLGRKLAEGVASVQATVLTRDPRQIRSDPDDERRRLVRFPYAVAIALGYDTFILRGGVL